MRIASRGKTIAFFITLGACGVGLAIALNITWVIINWKEVVPLVLGIFFFGFIIAGLVLNTIFLVREIRRNEQQDSFLNAVTHELKTPIASIRLYLETLQKRSVEESQRHDFYRIMLEDTDRLLGTVEQVLKAGEERHGTNNKKHNQEVDFSSLVTDSVELARLRHKVTTARASLRSSAGSGDHFAGKSGGTPNGSGEPARQRGEVFRQIDRDRGGCSESEHGYGGSAGPRQRNWNTEAGTQTHLQALLSREDIDFGSGERNGAWFVHRAFDRAAAWRGCARGERR